MIELSSSLNEEDFFVDTARDAEFARRLFGNLNRDLLRPPDDGKVIVLNDSNEEEEAREKTVADVEAAPPASSAANADEDLGKMQDDNSVDLAPQLGHMQEQWWRRRSRLTLGYRAKKGA
jgi:hypothetical protein